VSLLRTSPSSSSCPSFGRVLPSEAGSGVVIQPPAGRHQVVTTPANRRSFRPPAANEFVPASAPLCEPDPHCEPGVVLNRRLPDELHVATAATRSASPTSSRRVARGQLDTSPRRRGSADRVLPAGNRGLLPRRPICGCPGATRTRRIDQLDRNNATCRRQPRPVLDLACGPHPLLVCFVHVPHVCTSRSAFIGMRTGDPMTTSTSTPYR